MGLPVCLFVSLNFVTCVVFFLTEYTIQVFSMQLFHIQ